MKSTGSGSHMLLMVVESSSSGRGRCSSAMKRATRFLGESSPNGRGSCSINLVMGVVGANPSCSKVLALLMSFSKGFPAAFCDNQSAPISGGRRGSSTRRPWKKDGLTWRVRKF